MPIMNQCNARDVAMRNACWVAFIAIFSHNYFIVNAPHMLGSTRAQVQCVWTTKLLTCVRATKTTKTNDVAQTLSSSTLGLLLQNFVKRLEPIWRHVCIWYLFCAHTLQTKFSTGTWWSVRDPGVCLHLSHTRTHTHFYWQLLAHSITQTTNSELDKPRIDPGGQRSTTTRVRQFPRIVVLCSLVCILVSVFAIAANVALLLLQQQSKKQRWNEMKDGPGKSSINQM
jgi:hypothetical protein